MVCGWKTTGWHKAPAQWSSFRHWIYDLEAKTYDWLTDFGDWPIWLNDNRHLLFVSQGTIYLFDTEVAKVSAGICSNGSGCRHRQSRLSRDNRRFISRMSLQRPTYGSWNLRRNSVYLKKCFWNLIVDPPATARVSTRSNHISRLLSRLCLCAER